jgi:hypothetical protein
MLFAACLIFWVACIATVALSWRFGLAGAPIVVGCFAVGYACFSDWLRL